MFACSNVCKDKQEHCGNVQKSLVFQFALTVHVIDEAIFSRWEFQSVDASTLKYSYASVALKIFSLRFPRDVFHLLASSSFSRFSTFQSSTRCGEATICTSIRRMYH